MAAKLPDDCSSQLQHQCALINPVDRYAKKMKKERTKKTNESAHSPYLDLLALHSLDLQCGGGGRLVHGLHLNAG